MIYSILNSFELFEINSSRIWNIDMPFITYSNYWLGWWIFYFNTKRFCHIASYLSIFIQTFTLLHLDSRESFYFFPKRFLPQRSSISSVCHSFLTMLMSFFLKQLDGIRLGLRSSCKLSLSLLKVKALHTRLSLNWIFIYRFLNSFEVCTNSLFIYQFS